MKTIVTHIGPDLDAATSVWLIKRYLAGWENAEYAFVPAGKTLEDKKPDEDSEIIHVDTGLGKFDHHQLSDRTSASAIVFEHIKKNGTIAGYDLAALERLVAFVTVIDNFGEVHFPDPTADMYDFTLYQFSEGVRPKLGSDAEMLNFFHLSLDGILQVLKNKVRAEAEIKNGAIFHTSWGKAIVMDSKNEEAMKLALKLGYTLVARRDPLRGTIRIKTLPDPKYDLTKLHDILTNLDPGATWFLHGSKNMLLNGSSKNPESVPSKVPLTQLIEIIKAM